MSTSLPARRESQQARSTETSRKLLAAAETLLEEKSFDDTSVQEIALRAGVTTGAFYARFRDKEAVLQVLEEQLYAAMENVADQQSMPERWTGRAMEDMLRQHHTNLVRTYREHRGAARALLLRASQDVTLQKRFEQLNKRNLPIVARAIATHGKLRHPGGAKAIHFALLTVRSMCREVILFNQSYPGSKPPSDELLVEELTRMMMSYLGLPQKRSE